MTALNEESKEFRYAEVPADEWIRYMAIFYRALVASERYVETKDLVGIWLAGWILDALHNIPYTLRHYSETVWHSPNRTSAWIRHWSEFKSGPGYPDWMVSDCREIFTFDISSNLRTLCLKEESQVIRPPDAVAEILLDRLYWWCVWFRMSMRMERFMNDLSLDEYEKYRRYCMGAFAKGLFPVPLLLVRWSERDWEEYRQMIQMPPSDLPDEYIESWHNFFAPIREA